MCIGIIYIYNNTVYNYYNYLFKKLSQSWKPELEVLNRQVLRSEFVIFQAHFTAQTLSILQNFIWELFSFFFWRRVFQSLYSIEMFFLWITPDTTPTLQKLGMYRIVIWLDSQMLNIRQNLALLDSWIQDIQLFSNTECLAGYPIPKIPDIRP